LGILIATLAFLVGCGGADPVSPVQGPNKNITPNVGGQVGDDNRYDWGLWEITVNTESMTAEIIPLRIGQIHYNVLQMLEGWACTNCVRIVNLTYNADENLEVEIGIRHPYPKTRLDLTGRDVRGIAIFPGTLEFSSNFVRDKNGIEKPLLASEILVNADGWTTHFNRETADEGTGLYDYKRGKLTFPTESTIQGNLHPFKCFSTSDYKRLFHAGYEVIETYELAIPFQSEFTFAYSVDANWSMPLEWPVTNPVLDFPTSASAREAFQISMSIDSSTLTQQGGSADVTIDIFDHQGCETISVIAVEAPDLWVGNKNIDPTTPLWSNEEQARYEFTIVNETGHAKTDNEGGSPMLIAVEDIGMSVVGEDVKGYQIFRIPAQDVAKDWRPRDNTFNHLGFIGPGPTPKDFDVSIISDPVAPWAFVPGESMILVANNASETYVAYNRDFDNWTYLAGYPGSPNSWITNVLRIDATSHGALGVTSDSDEVVNGEYLVKHCTHSHYEGGIYSTSWYTGSLDDVPPYLEYPGDVSAGFGTSVGDPIYAMYLFDSTAGYLPPPSLSIHRIGAPYDDPDEVQRAKIPAQDFLNGAGGPFGISSRFFKGLGIDDEPVGEVNPFVAHVYIAENEDLGGGNTNRELDIYRVNFAYTADLSHLKTYDNTNLGNSYIGPLIGDPKIVDVALLPAYANNVYMGAGQYPEHNWVAVLYTVNPSAWFIEIFDPFLPDGQWQVPIYYTGSYAGNAFALDVDTKNFEIYVLHDDAPLGTGAPQLTCLEYY